MWAETVLRVYIYCMIQSTEIWKIILWIRKYCYRLMDFRFFASGKSALHWAAAVNNVEAVNTLLRAGCNRDAQSEREETPLFLAAKEGSYETIRILLDHYANRDITDHMDRSVNNILLLTKIFLALHLRVIT